MLGIGKSGEPYEGIGRGELNIEGMPVYRDAMGGIGTPTSDNAVSYTHLDVYKRQILFISQCSSGWDDMPVRRR